MNVIAPSIFHNLKFTFIERRPRQIKCFCRWNFPLQRFLGVDLCAYQFEASTSPLPRANPPNLNFCKLDRSNSRPSGQIGVQMPYPVVGFVCQMPLFKNNRCRLLSSLIKLEYKHADTYFVTLYMMMMLLPDVIYYKNTTLTLKLLKMTWNWMKSDNVNKQV